MQVDHQTPVDAGALEAFVRTIFERCGMGPPDAATLAGSLVDADLRGVHSHGVLRVPEYVAKLAEGGVAPRRTPRRGPASHHMLLFDFGAVLCHYGRHHDTHARGLVKAVR